MWHFLQRRTSRRTSSRQVSLQPPPDHPGINLTHNPKLPEPNQGQADTNFPEEGGPEALGRIWLKYAAEADKFDDRKMNHLHKTLDVILLFVSHAVISVHMKG